MTRYRSRKGRSPRSANISEARRGQDAGFEGERCDQGRGSRLRRRLLTTLMLRRNTVLPLSRTPRYGVDFSFGKMKSMLGCFWSSSGLPRSRSGGRGLLSSVWRTRFGRVPRKWRRKGLKRLNPRLEMVWGRKPRTYKMWYTGARLTMRDSGRAARKTKLLWDNVAEKGA